MILLIDIGNTRLKWAELRDGVLSAQSAVPHARVDRNVLLEQMLATVHRPTRVLISNVGGRDILEACVAAIRARWSIEAETIVSTARAAGVTNAYREPAKLGVDRWLAIIAAHARQEGSACVVSVGTAMTIDGVDAAGQHLGGVIVPGPQLMVSSLLHSTSDIAERMTEADTTRAVFGDHTNAAVMQGCAHALAGLVDRALAEMRQRLGSDPALLLTGGGAQVIAPLVGPHELVPDLVLRGLAILAAEQASGR